MLFRPRLQLKPTMITGERDELFPPPPQPALRAQLEGVFDLHERLTRHPVFSRLTNLPALQVFMEHHVYAVWDFMCLLKGLQRELTCVQSPWLPPADRSASRLVNEIVLTEESDDDGSGGFCSHFELYRAAMLEAGASTRSIDPFLAQLCVGASVSEALQTAEAPLPARAFVASTMRVVDERRAPNLAAAFFYGREQLIPDMFRALMADLPDSARAQTHTFRRYLDRHIEVDGDKHGPAAGRLLTRLCGDNEVAWEEALGTAVRCLEARVALWDGALRAIETRAS